MFRHQAPPSSSVKKQVGGENSKPNPVFFID
jgi:hypothetical protein